MWPNGKKSVRSKDPAWGNRLRAAWAPSFLPVWLFLVLALSGCTTVPGFDEEGKSLNRSGFLSPSRLFRAVFWWS